MRLSINQPYYVPYVGYFRLMTSADLFIIYDDVQYTSQSWVNRNKLTRKDGMTDWLTMPLRYKHLGTRIKDVAYAEDMSDRWEKICSRFKVFEDHKNHKLVRTVGCAPYFSRPLSAIVGAMEDACEFLDIKWNAELASNFNIGIGLSGQDRVLAICEHFGATEYINAPGGVSLYDKKAFAKRGIELKFLEPYSNKTSVLERLAYEDPREVRKEMDAQSGFIS